MSKAHREELPWLRRKLGDWPVDIILTPPRYGPEMLADFRRVFPEAKIVGLADAESTELNGRAGKLRAQDLSKSLLDKLKAAEN